MKAASWPSELLTAQSISEKMRFVVLHTFLQTDSQTVKERVPVNLME